jgi:4-carboxymuconolactone decarboxylase
MSRIPYPDLADVAKAKLDAVGHPGRPMLNITRIALLAPDAIWHAHYGLKRACIDGTTLDPRLREVLILRVAHLSRCAYELHHHLSISANLGFTPQMQAALAEGRYDALSEAERAVAQFTDEVVRDVRASDATLARARALFGDALVMEMLILIGSYMSTARMAQTTGVEPDPEPIRSWPAPAAAPAQPSP